MEARLLAGPFLHLMVITTLLFRRKKWAQSQGIRWDWSAVMTTARSKGKFIATQHNDIDAVSVMSRK
jgi:hypothetical protein